MATVTEKIIEVKTKVEKANNIKELKETIADLTQQMEDYQEKMRKGEDVTADYEKTIEGLVDAQEKLTNVMKAGTSQISAQEGSYNALVNRMAALKKVQKSVTDDSSRVKLAEDINTINDQLKAYDQANGVYVRNVGNYKSALEDLDGTVLDFGGSMRQAMETIEPTKAKFESIQKIASGVASGFAAVQGMAALLGAENEELQKTFVKVQSAMAIAQGIGGLKDLFEGIAQWGVAFGKTVQEAQNMAKASTALTAATEATAAAIETTASVSAADATAKNAEAVAAQNMTKAATTLTAASEATAAASEASASASAADATAKNAEAVAAQNMTKASTALTAASEASAAASEASASASAADATAKNAEAVAAQNMTKASTVLTASSKASAVASKESATASAADATAKSAAAVATQNMAKASTVLTAASEASAAASAADATAKGAAAVATEGATVAQTGLNTAMMANPIGLVVAAVAGLVAVFVLLKDDIVELLGGTEKLNAAWQKLTPILSGVGNVIKQVVLGPIKTFITSLKTIVSTVSNLAKGDFSAAFEAIKDGALQVVDDIKDTYNVIGNFQEGYADKSTEIEEKRIRKAAELRDKELEQFIKDNEAKSGSDWKYTEEGKKAYEEYYKNKEQLYDKDSEEYRQNQRDIWMYNREYQDRITKKEQDESKKRQESLKKSLEDEKKAREKALQDYNTMVEEYLKSDGDKMEDTWEKRRKALENALKKNLITYEEYDDKKKKLEKEISIEKANFDFNIDLSNFDVETKLSELKAKSKELNFKYRVDIEGEDIDKIEYINNLYNEQTEIYEKEDGILAKLAARVVEFANEYGGNSELAINATKELHSATLEYLNLGIDKFKAISDVRIEALEKEIAKEEAAMEKRTFMLEQQYLEYESSNKYLFDFGNNYLTQMYKRWAAEDEINKSRIESLETMKQKYIEASQDMQLTEYERVKAKEEADRLEREIEEESANHTIAVNRRKSEAADNYVSTIQDSLSGIGDILSNVANAWETSIQAQIDAGEISEEEGEKQMENMRGIQSAIAMINALSSAVGAYNSMASIPFVGPALGAAAAAAALASGIAQVVAINKVKKGDKGGEDDSRYAEAIPTMPDYNPQAVTNVTGEQETQNLANAMSASPIKAYVVESEITSTQQKVANRNKEATF